MATTKNKRPTPRKVIYSGADEAERVYANSVQLQTTPWDFRFTFGEIVSADVKKLEISEKVVLHMSPQHTKATLDLIQKHVKAYEDKYGPIITPSELGEKDPVVTKIQ